MVPGVALEPHRSEARLVSVARRSAWGRPAQQLAEQFWRERLGMGRNEASVLLPCVLKGATRSELAPPGGGGGHARGASILVQEGRRRVSHRCALASHQR